MSHAGFCVDDPTERGAARAPQQRRVVPEPTLLIADGLVEVLLVRLDAEPAPTGELAWCLSDAERVRAGRFVFERDRRRFVAGRARLRQLLASRLGTRADRVELAYGPRGKPRLAGGSALRFNLSHCGDVALYAFSNGREVGVDVEAVRELPGADDVTRHFLSPRERAAYLRLPARERSRAFFRCWTRKEAFIKALGTGLAYPLTEFDASPAPTGWSLRSFAPGAGLAAAVAVATG
jgi:4'-phosphopantetheinyl transferase